MRLSRAWLVLVGVAIAGCNTPPTAPEITRETARRTTYMCVGTDADGTIVLMVPEAGECDIGFDLRPWT